MKICALLVPKEFKVERTDGVKDLTDEQLEAAIEAVKAIVDARAAQPGDGAKVIEGTAEATALPVPTELEQPQRKRPNRLLEHVNTAIGPSERGKRKPQVAPPKVFEAVGRHFRVPDRMLNVLMPEVVLQGCPSRLSVIGDRRGSRPYSPAAGPAAGQPR